MTDDPHCQECGGSDYWCQNCAKALAQSHDLHGHEITSLRTRLAASEAEVARLKAVDEVRHNLLVQKELEYAHADGGRLIEIRKREEAERAIDTATDLLDGQHEYESCHCTSTHGRDCLECRTYKPGYRCQVQRAFALLIALLPPAKKSQEGA